MFPNHPCFYIIIMATDDDGNLYWPSKIQKKRTETEWEWIKKLYIMSGGDAIVIIYNFYYIQVLGNKTLKIISDELSIKVTEFP